MTRLRIFWLGCLLLAAASQLAYHFIDPPTLDNQGMLHEQFGPVSYTHLTLPTIYSV